MRDLLIKKLRVLIGSWIHTSFTFPLGLCDIVIWFIRGRESTLIIRLFSKKFGHFLMNTESFLIDLEARIDGRKVIYFLDKLPYDNNQMKEVWAEIIAVEPYGRMIAWLGLSKWSSKIEVISYPITWSQSGLLLDKEFGDTNFYRAVKQKPKYWEDLNLDSNRPLIAITIRHSSYQAAVLSGSLQSWRDNDLSVVNNVVDSLDADGFQVVLANYISDPSVKKELSKQLLIRDFSLVQQARLFESSVLVLCGATGVDWIPVMQGRPAVLYNWQLGTSFPSVIIRSKSIVVPQRVFNISSDRFLTLKEYSQLLQHIEIKYSIDRLEETVQLATGVRTVHPNAKEILDAVERLRKWILDDTEIEPKAISDSWKGYPRIWNHMNRPWIAFDKSKLRSYLQYQ